MSRSAPPHSAASSPRNVDNLSLSRLVEQYLELFAAASSHTARAKKIDLKQFVEFLTELRQVETQSALKVRDWDHSSVTMYVEHLLSGGASPATVGRRLATLKHMGRTFAERIPGFVNPARDVRPPKTYANRPKGLTMAEVREVIDRAEARISKRPSFIRRRNRAILLVMLDTGLRADEVRQLKLSQIADDLQWIARVRTKGRQFRNVYIPSTLRGELRDYLKARRRELERFFLKLSEAQSRNLPLFISTYGADRLDPRSFFMGAKTLWRAIRELTVDLKLHPHLLRHSFALDLLNSSGDIRLVSQALGHSDMRVTMRYTERREQEVAAAVEKSKRRAVKRHDDPDDRPTYRSRKR